MTTSVTIFKYRWTASGVGRMDQKFGEVRLETIYCVRGTDLDWFASYLSE